jgi:alpha-2-macroglobulin
VAVPWPEQPSRVAIEHRGAGAPWALVRSRAAVPLEQPLASGYRVRKTVSVVERKDAAAWSVGDVFRVRLEIDAQSDMTWVVVDDPVPAGATLLGSGLGTDSALLAASESEGAGARPVFEERGFAAYRAYYQYLPKGRAVLEYTARIDNEGEFRLPATRVEAMYAPEMFGESPNPAWTVRP